MALTYHSVHSSHSIVMLADLCLRDEVHAPDGDVVLLSQSNPTSSDVGVGVGVVNTDRFTGGELLFSDLEALLSCLQEVLIDPDVVEWLEVVEVEGGLSGTW